MHEAPDRSQVVKTFGGEAADFIEVAASLGWGVLFNNTGTSCTLVPAVEDAPARRIHLSSRNKGGGLMKKYAKRLAKYGTRQGIDAAVYIADSDLPFEIKRQIQLGLGQMAMQDEGATQVMPEEKPKERFVPTPAAVAEKVKKERHVISERPALMHYNISSTKGGQSYPSKTTVERRWSDGSIDYICAVASCGETSENRRSFGGQHWAMHVRKGEAEPVDMEEAKKTIVVDPSYTEHAWTRKQSLKAKRTHELAEMLKAIDLGKVTPEDLAEMIIEFLGDLGIGGGASGEPLTDAQIIDRIRTLVDRGTYADQEKAILDRDQQIEDLTQYAEARELELDAKVLELEQRAVAAETHLQALRDLINESVGGD